MTKRIAELPGALFLGAIDLEDVALAVRLQRIRREYETDACEEMLWADLSELGVPSAEICRFAGNPTAITSCAYFGPGSDPLSYEKQTSL